MFAHTHSRSAWVSRERDITTTAKILSVRTSERFNKEEAVSQVRVGLFGGTALRHDDKDSTTSMSVDVPA